MKTVLFCAVVLFVATCLVSVSLADDWQEWRGVNRDGISVETNWLTNWPPAEVWSSNIGTGCASVAVYDGRLYAAGNSGDKSEHVVYCFNAYTGDLYWTNAFSLNAAKNYGPMATPTVSGGEVYFYSQDNQLAIYDRLTGQQEWLVVVADDIALDGLPTDGAASSPLVFGNKVIFNHGKYGTALDKDLPTMVLWGNDTSVQGGFNSPVPCIIEGDEMVVMVNHEGDVNFMLLDSAADGTPVISHSLGTTPGNVNADVIVDTSGATPLVILVGTGVAMYDIVYNPILKEGALEEERTFSYLESIEARYANPVRADGHIYGSCFLWPSPNEWSITCFRAEAGGTGTQWSRSLSSEGLDIVYQSRPDIQMFAVDGRVVMMNADGKVNIMKAQTSSYNDEGRSWIQPFDNPDLTELGGEYAAPVVANGLMYCRSQGGELVCLKVGTGEPPNNDGDSLPDDWEQKHFQSRNSCDPSGHGDSDMQTNKDEYLAGTDPTNSASYFGTDIRLEDGKLIVSCDGIEASGPGYDGLGLARYYTLFECDDLVNKTWSADPAYSNVVFTGGNRRVVYTNAAPSTAGYYRFKAELK